MKAAQNSQAMHAANDLVEPHHFIAPKNENDDSECEKCGQDRAALIHKPPFRLEGFR